MAEKRVSSSSSDESVSGMDECLCEEFVERESSDEELILVPAARNAVNSDVSNMPYCISVGNHKISTYYYALNMYIQITSSEAVYLCALRSLLPYRFPVVI